jgi:folate-binding protein YgfZ
MTHEAGVTEAALEREYRAAREGAGLVTLARGTLEVSGPKRQDYLHAMLSNEVKSLRPGEGRRAASMTVRGSLQALVRVLVDASVVVLETEQDRVERVLRTLEHHKVGAPVRFATRPVAVLGLLGPRAEDVLRSAGAELPAEALDSHRVTRVADQDVRIVRAGDLPGGGFVLHVAPEASAAVQAALEAKGAVPVGREALDALRVEAICPWYGADVTEDNLLHETGLLPVVHSSTKGCYVGQEVVARLEGRGGNVNKALRGLRLAAPAAAGTAVTASGKEVGWLTTSAVSPRLGPVALAYVHRSHFAPGSAVEVDGRPATVVTGFAAASERDSLP